MSVIIFLNMYSYSMFFINSIKNIYNNFNHKPSWTSKCHAFWQENTSQIIENVVTNFLIKLPFLKKHFSFCKPEVQHNINPTIVTTEDSSNNKSELVLQNLTKKDFNTLTFEQVTTVPVGGNNLLHQAAVDNNVEFIKYILENNLSDQSKAYNIIDKVNNQGQSFLDIAFQKKNLEVIYMVAAIFDEVSTQSESSIPPEFCYMTRAQYDIGLFLNRNNQSNSPVEWCVPQQYLPYLKTPKLIGDIVSEE
jgi:hypothetical protein